MHAPLAYLSQLVGWTTYALHDPQCIRGRSPKWASLRKRYLKEHPLCVVSGSHCRDVDDMEVHHFKPYWDHPELELEWTNLRTVRRPYHFLVAHFCDWNTCNPDFDSHAQEWLDRVRAHKRHH